MSIFRKKVKLGPLTLNRDELIKIETELTSIWNELVNSEKSILKLEIADHNLHVKEKGYDFKLGSKYDKKIFKKDEIEEYINNKEVIESRFRYPIKRPQITYKDDEKELESIDNIQQLFEYNLQPHFDRLSFAVYGENGKNIELKLTSNMGFFDSPESNNSLRVSSNDEMWNIAIVDKLTRKLSKLESTSAFFYSGYIQFIFYLILPILSVYEISKMLNYFFSNLSINLDFNIFLFILIDVFVFFFAIALFDKLYSQLVKGTILEDQVSKKNKNYSILSWSVFIGVVASIVYDICKLLISIIK